MIESAEFNSLPEHLKTSIKDWLKVYVEVDVTYFNGEYHIGGVAIYDSYATDYKWIGTYNQADVYSEEERILNFMEVYHEYHILYKGEQDYKWLKTLSYDDTFKLDKKGNIVKA